MSIKETGSGFYARITVEGKEYRETLSTREDAEKWQKEKRNAVLAENKLHRMTSSFDSPAKTVGKSKKPYKGSIDLLPSGHYRGKIRISGKTISKTFLTKDEAVAWLSVQSKRTVGYEKMISTYQKQTDAKRKSKVNINLPFLESDLKHSVDSELNKIDTMNGFDFEEYIASLLFLSGFFPNAVIYPTKAVGDYGVDVIVELPNSIKYAVQCKRFNTSVGIKAIQQIYSGAVHYNADFCACITNNYFTPAAIELAKETNVSLIDRDMLKKLIEIEKKNIHRNLFENTWDIMMKEISRHEGT